MRHSIWRGLAVAAAASSLAACNHDSLLQPNYNAPTVEGLATDPAGLQLAATGILATERANYAGYIRDVSIFGREGYYYFPTDNRYVTDYLIGAGGGALSSTGFASGNFFGFFRNMRNAVNLVSAADKSSLSAQQKSAVKGLAKTFRALDLYYEITLRDTLGLPTEIRPNPADQAPYQSRDSVYKAIEGFLDDAKADLTAAGTASFPFALHSGFSGFDAPATFLRVNQAIAARVYAVHGSIGCGAACYNKALTAVAGSFVTAPGAAASVSDLNRGVYTVYSSAAGDALNVLNFQTDVNQLAHASAVKDAQLQTDGVTPDAREQRKIGTLAQPRNAPGGKGIPANYFFTIYPALDSPTPIIRNEELILIRAEANLQTNNAAAALVDLNNLRAVSGSLPPITVASIDNLIYERRMSLLFEGFRWIDARRFGRLNTLPLDLPTHFVARVVPIPKAECDARIVSPAPGC
jgi:hypothetical protein